MTTKPDYTLSAMNKATGKRGVIGAGWTREDGSISLTINPYVILDGNDSELVLMLFKQGEWPNKSKAKKVDEESCEPPF